MEKETHSLMAAEVAVVGAGPAGMMAAIAAGSAGRRVVVVEQLGRPGAKLLATGGGRCNLTNTLEVKDFLARCGRGRAFMRHAITELDCQALREFFRDLGVETVCEEGGAVYPATHSAATVQKAMLARCRELGVQFLLGAEATDLLLKDGEIRGLAVRGKAIGGGEGGEIVAPRVVLAAGGRSYPELGGTGGGYALARGAGHEVIEPTPALVDLRMKEPWPAGCAGISVPGARVSIDVPRSAKRQAFSTNTRGEGVTGDVLFTHEGLSGPAVLDLSGDVVELLRKIHPSTGSARLGSPHAGQAEVPILVELLPGTTVEQWRRRLEEWRQSQGRRAVRGLVAELLPARLGGTVCALASVGPQTTAAHLDSRQRHALAGVLAGVRLTVTSSGGFGKAMVTRGGVRLDQVDARTMESRLVKGLFFAGEVLDVDGPCGGFNLQWAFSSGRLAGISAAR